MIKTMEMDDQSFDMIVTYARRAIRKYAPDWTDENAHDPGITLIELMAWLKEMLQFYMDQTTEPLEEQFLRLLGLESDYGKPATTVVQCIEKEAILHLPERTKLSKGRYIFETKERQTIEPIVICDVLASYEGQRRSVFQNLYNGLSVYPFGGEAKNGSLFYLVFNEAIDFSRTQKLYFQLYERYKIPRNPIHEPQTFVPLADLTWLVGPDLEHLEPIEIERDDTLGLIRSGLVVFAKAAKKGSVVAIRLNEANYDHVPRILDVFNRVIEVIQRDTLSYETDPQLIFDSTGLPNQKIRIPYERLFYKNLGVEVLSETGEQGQWQAWQQVKNQFEAEEEALCFFVEPKEGFICFGDGKNGKIPQKGVRSIRISNLERSYLDEGNIELDYLTTNDGSLKFKCLQKATGGCAFEQLSDLKNKLFTKLREPVVCASASDYETMALQTPGLRLKRVKCLPMYRPHLSDYPNVLAENSVALFVIPDGPERLNRLNRAYIANLRRHTEKHRPITTELYILDPSYYEVHLYFEIVSHLEEAEAKQRAELAIQEMKDFNLGESVTKSGLYRQLRKTGVVSQVKSMTLSCDSFVSKNRLGDLLIPPDGVAVIVSVEILVVSDH